MTEQREEDDMMTNVIMMVTAALIQVESGGKADAVGDSGRAVGAMQMWPIAVKEANRLTKNGKVYTDEDRKSVAKSKEMAFVILAHHYNRGVTDPVDLACRWRNPKGDAPDWYRRKVTVQLERMDYRNELAMLRRKRGG